MTPVLRTTLGLSGLLACTVAGAACDSGASLALPPATEIDVPAGAGAALPHVAAAGDRAILSWVEPADTGHVLRFAEWDGSSWTEPRTVAAGSDWFVNWADFPSVVALAENDLAAHWLQRSADGTYAYDVMISRSSDGGERWTQPVRPHSDGTPTEHGFVSMFPVEGGLGVVWLDGRKFAGSDTSAATNEMTVRFATLPAGGDAAVAGSATTVMAEHVLDERACDCCQTGVALTARGPLIVYRDRSEEEIRDISVTRLIDGQWTAPRRLHADDWKIDACPVNGPQADASGDDVVVAWFTAANDTPRVHVAFSHDAGDTFSAPLRVDGGNPVGRVDVLLLDPERALVVWLERTDAGAEVTGRIVTRDGRAGEPAAMAQTLAQRPSGFPRMGRYGRNVLLAWTEPGDSSRVRAATLDLTDF